jgi:integrase
MVARKRRFGRVRQLPSGRWQARYPGPDGIDRPAPQTFERKAQAERWLIQKEAEVLAGGWTDPDAGLILFRAYADEWLRERHLRPKTHQLYEGLLRLHLYPTFGGMAVGDIRERHVRSWRARILDTGPGASTVAKAYRLLRAIMNTAVEDELIRRNPCRIRGAGTERPSERPVLTIPQVFALIDAMPPRFRALVLLGTFASLRWGELAALRRHCVDLDARTVRVEAAVVELRDGSLVTGRPKTEAGIRRVAIPAEIVDDLRWHLQRFAEREPDGLVFVGEKGAPLRRSNFSRPWKKALAIIEVEGLHFHDLRHTGNSLAAMTGANLRELMERMGHASTRAAMIYLHATADRDRAIADALGTLAQAEIERRRESDNDDDDGPPLAGARL